MTNKGVTCLAATYQEKGSAGNSLRTTPTGPTVMCSNSRTRNPRAQRGLGSQQAHTEGCRSRPGWHVPIWVVDIRMEADRRKLGSPNEKQMGPRVPQGKGILI